jgi:hypothetical protein
MALVEAGQSASLPAARVEPETGEDAT